MINSSLITVIIPNYNYAQYIVKALESVAAQSYSNWECIIVDDGSTDNSRKVIEEFILKSCDIRFEVFFIANSGTSAAKNYGITKARGEYIQFLDADDLLSPYKFEFGIKLFEKSNASLVYSASVFFENINGRYNYFQKYPSKYLLQESLESYSLIRKLVTNNFATISSPIVKTTYVKSVNGFVNDLKQNEDWLFWFLIALENPIFTFDNSVESTVKIRVHNASAMHNSKKMFLGEKRIRIIFEKGIYNTGALSTAEKASLLKCNRNYLALLEIRSLNASAGFAYVIKSFIEFPKSNKELLIKALYKYLVRKVKLQ